MKTFFNLLCMGLLVSNFLQAQNLVPNPGFEDHSDCPEFLGSVRSYNFNSLWGLVPEWQANPPDCTPDYFHTCGKKKFKIPKNLCGEMPAYEGQAYIGMILRIGAVDYGDPNDLMYREHITATLSEPLKADFQYLVHFYVALSDYSNFAISNIGALFTQEAKIIKENQHYEPQICFKEGVIKKKRAWTLVQDTLLAKGGEKYITLGNFDEYAQRKMRKITQDTRYFKKFNYNRAYYYIDDIAVEEIGPYKAPIPENSSPDDTTLIFTHWGTIKPGQKVLLENIFFEFDKAELLPESLPELQKLLDLLYKDSTLSITTIGHTDSIGTTAKNQLLSENRAKSVIVFLEKHGIPSHRLFYKGFGESQPITGNDKPEGRRLNRRVEFVLHRDEQ